MALYIPGSVNLMEPSQVPPGSLVETELLMIGSSSCTYRHNQVIIKVPRIDDEAEITQANAHATKVEANVYRILGVHERIAKCLYISPTREIIILEFYPLGNLKDYIALHGRNATQVGKWANQMIDSVHYIHSKGVLHSDLRLEQWLLDPHLNARLGDFNSSGYDECPALDLPARKAVGIEDPSHFMPRDACGEDNSVRSDLFALGSALYEVEFGDRPFEGVDGETITRRFERGVFPAVEGFVLRDIILGAWEGGFQSGAEMLRRGAHLSDL
ncbi:hypothetical protein LTR62_007536 [Meristemomyces frigidus]|uniref:non-specific serine/threonine protein kinase n=1 Tax=Meristemomyces frigidus TaxID=1508187 RepID=A0AAN7YDL1_9PEZI|nr:hypothetical protein LTR62_007536 [Meristemomyces frigidus]